MNYTSHYESLVAKARERKRPDGYVERHHIVPRSLGGDDAPDNLVWLTAREHFVAHVLLAHMHGGAQWYAVMMFAAGAQRSINSRLYAMAKLKHAAWMSANFSGKKLSDQHRKRIGEGLIGNRNTAGKPLQETHRASIGRGLRGNTNTLGKSASTETRARMSLAHSGEKHHYFGKTRDAETRVKISEKLRGVPRAPRSEETKARIRAGVLAANAARKANPNP
jgi:hypothetical protein